MQKIIYFVNLGVDLAALGSSYVLNYEAIHASAKYAMSKGYTASEVSETVAFGVCAAAHNVLQHPLEKDFII